MTETFPSQASKYERVRNAKKDEIRWQKKNGDVIAEMQVMENRYQIRFKADSNVFVDLDEKMKENNDLGIFPNEEQHSEEDDTRVFLITKKYNWNSVKRDFATTIDRWLKTLSASKSNS